MKSIAGISRRGFLSTVGLAGIAAVTNPRVAIADDMHPRADAIRKLREARFGLFVHYGFASLLPGGKFLPRPKEITDADLERKFTAEKFDANFIADLAVAAGMRYVNFTPYHGGGPYNWRSKVAHPNTHDDLPARRDLTGELAAACRKRGLGFFLYVHGSIAQSHAAVWERNRAIFREWLTNYGPIAGFWFDTDSAYYKDKSRSLYPHLAEIFALIREIQPQSLISFCHGVTGDEDYITYEHRFHQQSEFKFVPPEVQLKLADKPVEICSTLQLQEKGGKGTKMWFNVEGAYHRTQDEVWQLLAEARRDNCNLLINAGPLGDGSIHPADVATLREVGRRIKEHGFPPAAAKPTTTTEGEDR